MLYALLTWNEIPGKDFSLDFVWVMRFTLEGKGSRVRAYYDTHHLDDLVEDHKGMQEED